MMNGIVIEAPGKVAIKELPVPKLRDDYILVRTTALALNPTDCAHIDGRAGPNIGHLVGCDYAGIVEEIGRLVTKSFKKGDRICGIAHGANQMQPEDGTFAEYILVKGDLQMASPSNDVESATLGVGIATVGQGLYQCLGLPLPTKPARTSMPILIYGGSTATGILGIQFAKRSGLTVLTTASPHNFDYLKSLGADACFDYHSPHCAADVRDFVDGKLRHAWDCISTADSAKLCAAALSDDENGGTYASLKPVPGDVITAVNPHVRNKPFTLVYTIFGEDFTKYGKSFPVSKEDAEFARKFVTMAHELLAAEIIQAAHVDVNRGGKGLEGVVVGLDELRHNKVSGTKLVYTMEP
ncbi:GroES-like protein [Trichoderma sp. TUCIM 5745]